jgi:hypothetical protein
MIDNYLPAANVDISQNNNEHISTTNNLNDNSTVKQKIFIQCVRDLLLMLSPAQAKEWINLVNIGYFEYLHPLVRLAYAGYSVNEVLSSPLLGEEALRSLYQSIKFDIPNSIAICFSANPASPPDIAEKIDDLFEDSVLKKISSIRTGKIYESIKIDDKNEDIPPHYSPSYKTWQLRKLASNPDLSEYDRIRMLSLYDHERFSNLHISAETLQSLHTDFKSNYEVLAGIARHPNCPQYLKQIIIDDLFNAATDGNACAGILIASNKDIEIPKLQILAELNDWRIKASVFINPKCPASLRDILDEEIPNDLEVSQSENGHFLYDIHSIHNFPGEIFTQMFQRNWICNLYDFGYNGFCAIPTHPNWPWNNEKILSHEAFSNYWIYHGIEECIERFDVIEDGFLVPLVKFAILENLDGTGSWCPGKFLLRMAGSKNASPELLVEMGKAGNKHTDPDTEIEVIDCLVLVAARNHPAYPIDDLNNMAEALKIIGDPYNSKYWLDEISKLDKSNQAKLNINNPLWIGISKIQEYALDEFPIVFKLIKLSFGNLSEIDVNNYADSDVVMERAALASNESISSPILEKLASDKSTFVSSIARETLGI